VGAAALTTILLAFLCFLVGRRWRRSEAHAEYSPQELFPGHPYSSSMYQPVPFTETSSLPPSLPESPPFMYADPYRGTSETVAYDPYSGYETPSSPNTSPGFGSLQGRQSEVSPATRAASTTTQTTTQTTAATKRRKGPRPLLVEEEPRTSIIQHVDAGPSSGIEELPPAYSHIR
jgi:hypothetical protein